MVYLLSFPGTLCPRVFCILIFFSFAGNDLTTSTTIATNKLESLYLETLLCGDTEIGQAVVADCVKPLLYADVAVRYTVQSGMCGFLSGGV